MRGRGYRDIINVSYQLLFDYRMRGESRVCYTSMQHTGIWLAASSLVLLALAVITDKFGYVSCCIGVNIMFINIILVDVRMIRMSNWIRTHVCF